MKTALTILALVIHGCYLNAQTYFNLQGGVAENTVTRNATLTYQAGLRYQPSDLGIKATFGQTDGIFHSFDSYTLSGTYLINDKFYLLSGYRHDNGRIWGPHRNGLLLGATALIPIHPIANIAASLEHYFASVNITNIMIGVQLDFNID